MVRFLLALSIIVRLAKSSSSVAFETTEAGVPSDSSEQPDEEPLAKNFGLVGRLKLLVCLCRPSRVLALQGRLMCETGARGVPLEYTLLALEAISRFEVGCFTVFFFRQTSGVVACGTGGRSSSFSLFENSLIPNPDREEGSCVPVIHEVIASPSRSFDEWEERSVPCRDPSMRDLEEEGGKAV